MLVTFWGTRGSIAKAGPSTLRYGGNTSCVEVRSDDGTLVVIDCGTGAHGLGESLLADTAGTDLEGHLLISHTHWDHIQGLPFFGPLFEPTHTWHVYGPRGLSSSISETLAGQMQYSYFPLTLEQLEAEVDYHDLVEGTLQIGDITVRTRYLNHPALTLGYRLEADGASLVYASDHEPHSRVLTAGGDVASSHHDDAHAEFLAGADLLIHDAQYRAHEYEDKAGWGHSTAEYVVDVARHAGVRQVALFHHDPSRTDDQVDDLVASAKAHAERAGYDGALFAAAEGTTIEIRGSNNTTAPAATRSAVAGAALDDHRASVLIAVLDPDVADLLQRAAEAEGVDVTVDADPESALRVIEQQRPSLILLEGGSDGDDVLRLSSAIRALDPPYGGEVGLVAVADHVGATGGAMTDWLVWPASIGYIRTKMRAWLLRQACRWQNAPLPPDEEQRLRSLRDTGILDTEPESRFDRYTIAASRAFDVPVALISLVDAGRQWFKSRVGLDAVESPRDMAFCAHAILDDEVLQVSDALEDPRFADNPLVVDDPRVRFYAGVPLKLADGTRAGTLCVIDFRPRVLDDGQLAELERMAAEVAAELEA
ncbi:MAG: MBL fold metallo-hydrolase [Acidimicrobiia bacterium]|nr:MBL fold metallo-hydrolase [Acidimicrobiia bacterium]